ncbi:MAG TPA: DUF3466 family protein [Tepidisphaeraceae bacterium]|nr:DUF3466 family protein [Tepidisphaeraceae bacterium]
MASGLALLFAATAHAAASYSITDLGRYDGRAHNYGVALNNAGVVVGYGADGIGAFGSTDSRPFQWHGGVLTGITVPGGGYGYASNVGGGGHVVGWYATGSTPSQRAFAWQGGTFTALSSLGGDRAAAKDTTGAGDAIVGWSDTAAGGRRATLWRNGTIMDLGSLSGWHDSVANAMNDGGGTIVGQVNRYQLDGSRPGVAVIWRNGLLQPMSNADPQGYGSYAADVNESGQVVGTRASSVGGEYDTAFVWHNGAVTLLGNLPRGISSTAHALNHAGVVVGTATVPFGQSFTYHAFVWNGVGGGGISDLNSLVPHDSGWTLVVASDINSAGQIVGWGVRDGQRHGFLLTPVPEPSALLALSVLGAAVSRRRRSHSDAPARAAVRLVRP